MHKNSLDSIAFVRGLGSRTKTRRRSEASLKVLYIYIYILLIIGYGYVFLLLRHGAISDGTDGPDGTVIRQFLEQLEKAEASHLDKMA